MKQILLAFYGDDFTGSTDALECICRAGAKAVLFVDPPNAEQLARYPGLHAFGVAGFTRSVPPGEMEAILIPAFTKLKSSGARHVHYKVCSTFDSSPRIGSIGKAIDCGATVFQHKHIPVVGGTPALGRYCLFGNLFARLGTAIGGNVFRIDRHPSMRSHPLTPSIEADLRVQLSMQTNKSIGLIDMLQLEKSLEKMNDHNTDEVIVIDTLSTEHLLKIGEWMDKEADTANAFFSVGASSVESALGSYWNVIGLLQPGTQWKVPGSVNNLLVVSGSCSPVTTAQIVHAKSKGFEEVIIDAQKIDTDDSLDPITLTKISDLLSGQKSVIVHTGEKQLENLSSRKLGKALGLVVMHAAEQALIKRVVIAGGDTSSFTARAMKIEAVEMIAPMVTGAPLCKAISPDKNIDGLEVNFKGGQVGGDNYFEVVREGKG